MIDLFGNNIVNKRNNKMKIIIPFSYAFEEEIKKIFSLKVLRRFETLVEFEVLEKEKSTIIQLALDSPFKFEKPLNSDIGVKVYPYLKMILFVKRCINFYAFCRDKCIILLC